MLFLLFSLTLRDYTGYKAFQIEESDGLNIRIVRIRNKTKTDNKEASSLEAAALTPQPTGHGKKRLTDEDDHGNKTVTGYKDNTVIVISLHLTKRISHTVTAKKLQY